MTEETIFAAALTKKTAGERQAFLDEACAGSPQLRVAVEELLKADSDAGSFLDRPPAALDATIVATGGSRDTVNSGAWITRLSFLKPADKPDRMGKLVSKVGEYEIIEVVGHGGMGAVLRAFDTKLSRVVAVKVMAPELAANPVAVKRFLREAQAGAAVHHDHVVTIHAVDETHQPPFIVMQFVEGQTLQDKIDREGTLELKHILRIGSQAAAGLAAAHKVGHIHRDVKPANILLENGVERVKISDFGLARAADDLQVTQTGIIAGTPQYMSPEQAKGEPIDARSDLFSLGSVLYTMCTGRPAFRADNPVAVLRRVCDDVPRPIRELNAEIPDWLCDIVEKLLAKEPEQRFQSATEVAELLAQHLAHLQQPASCPRPARVGPQSAAAVPLAASDIIKAEARYLWGTGIMSVVAAGLALVFIQKYGLAAPSSLAIWLLIGGAISLPVGLVNMYAAWQVESRQSYHWAMTAALLSLLPINPFLIFCLPITIWSLVTIRQAQASRLLAAEPKPRKPSPGHLIIEHPVLGLVAILMLLVAVGAATFMLTAAVFRLRSLPSQNSLASQMALVIRATKDELSRLEWLRLSVENPSLAGQLGDPPTKALLTFLADLPDATRQELLDQGYVKWPVSALPPAGQSAIASYESTLKLADSLPHRTAAALKQAHTGFAVVDLPRKKEKVISWFLIWPQDKHEWVTLVNTKALDNHPSYFAAHHERLSALRAQPDSVAPIDSTGRTAGSPVSVESAEWTQLFNGKDLTGWRTHPDKPGQWEVKDGVLVGSTLQSFLFSERGDFANYHLRAEVKINGRGDGGIFFRTPFALAFGPQNWIVEPAAGYEAELYNQPAPAGSLWQVNDKAPPSLLRRAALESLARANEWFTLELIANGNHFITKVNGKETVNCTDSLSKRSSGHFALAVAAPQSVVQFRKIEIKELPNDSTAQFPIGSSAKILSSSEWEWSVPENLGPALNSNKADGGPSLAADGLTLIFHSKRDGGLGSEDLWFSTRPSTDAAWPAPQNLGPGINTSYQDHEPCLSADGLSLLFTSNRPGGHGDSDLWLASRSAPGQPWLPPTNLGALVNSESADDSATLSSDGRTLVFNSNRPEKLGIGDLWMSTRPSDSETWPAPQNLGVDVNSPAYQGFATLASDSLALIFNSTRDGSPWAGPPWLSVRKSPADPWSIPKRLFPHDPKGAWSLCISTDHSTILFDSKRPGGQGDFDLWQVRRVKKSVEESD